MSRRRARSATANVAVSASNMAQRRLRGYRVKHGLDELVDLDAVPQSHAAEHDKRVAAAAATAHDNVSSGSSNNKDDKTQPATMTATTADTLHESSDDERSDVGDANDDEDSNSNNSGDDDNDVPSVHGSVFGADWAEWRRVKDALFPPSLPAMTTTTAAAARAVLRAKQAALETMDVWRARARKARPLPAYVDATQLLCSCVVLDEAAAMLPCSSAPSWAVATSARVRQQHYSAALSRAVHAMTGTFAVRAVDGRVVARTYRQRAARIAFPAEAVEVRQRVAHGDTLPSLDELRWVCALVLQYLYTNYWAVQEAHANEDDDEDDGKNAHTAAASDDDDANTAQAATSTAMATTVARDDNTKQTASSSSASSLFASIDNIKAFLDTLDEQASGGDDDNDDDDDDDDDDDEADMTPAGWVVA